MTQFELFIDDDRYSVPTLTFVVVSDTKRAAQVAERLLAESSHRHGVEICEGGRRLLGLGSFARPRESHLANKS